MSFDPNQYLQGVTDAQGSVNVTPVPKGEYNAQIADVTFAEQPLKTGEVAIKCNITWDIPDPNLKETLGRDPRVIQNFFVDIAPGGGLDYGQGKNVRLNRIREAVGQNIPGVQWNPEMLKGQMAKILIDHRPNKEDPDSPYTDVKKVGRAS